MIRIGPDRADKPECASSCSVASDRCLRGQQSDEECATDRVECLEECLDRDLSCQDQANAYGDTLADACALSGWNSPTWRVLCRRSAQENRDNYLWWCKYAALRQATYENEQRLQ